jgi:Fe-S-cluster containining protein
MQLRSVDTRAAAREKRGRLQHFLRCLQQDTPSGLDEAAEGEEKISWQNVSCLSCANCCRHMSPHYTPADVKRIALHFRLSPRTFKEKWLYRDPSGNWMNRSQPCPFLEQRTNKCTIYAIRPLDCAGFPHLSARPVEAYLDTHAQNIAYCPAAERFVDGLYDKLTLDF